MDTPKRRKEARTQLRERVVEAIKAVHDPEIPVDVYELGLIYEINVYPVNNVHVLMTLTSPNCPSAEYIPEEVRAQIQALKGINEVKVEVTFDPPYTSDMMSDVAKLELGLSVIFPEFFLSCRREGGEMGENASAKRSLRESHWLPPNAGNQRGGRRVLYNASCTQKFL